jgi:membrane protease YdiL (CAAX protease family)
MAGARVETELQLTLKALVGRGGTLFLLLGVLGWIAAGFVCALISAGVIAGGFAVLHEVPRFSAVPAPGKLLYILIASVVFQATLLLGALRQGRRAGEGDWRAGLGIRAIRHPGVVALLCGSMVCALVGFIGLVTIYPGVRAFAESVTPHLLSDQDHDAPGPRIIKLGLVAVLAPVSEELFFRGWMWEALRRRGRGILPTAVLTMIPWLLLHGIDSPGRILFVLPAAVIFPLARYVGDSVLASLSVHMTNNMAAVLLQFISSLGEN